MHDLRALVVDDSKVGRLTMLKKLEAMGLTVDMADSGQQALDYLAQHQPDVIFMDHMMPQMDGFEVTRRIKASPATRHIPIVIISGNEEAVFVEEARAAGAIDAIAKPPANEVLQALLTSLPRTAAEAVAGAEPPARPIPQPVTAAPAPAVDMAEVRALVERLLGEVVAPLHDDVMAEMGQRLTAASETQRRTLAEWSERLDHQTVALADLGRGMADAESLGKRLQALEQRLQPLELEAGRPLPDMEALRAQVEQRVERNLEQQLQQRIAAGLAESQAGNEALAPRLESLHQRFQDMQSSLDAHTARTEQRAGGWDGRLDALAEDLGHLSRDQQSLRTTLAELEQRVARLPEEIGAAQPPAAPMREDGDAAAEEARAERQTMQTELDALRDELRDELRNELRERLSETRLRELIAETLGNLPPPIAPQPMVEEQAAPPPSVSEGLQTEVTTLRDKVKTLTTLTAIGGAVLLAAIAGLVIWG